MAKRKNLYNFKMTMMGYDTKQVDSFLDHTAASYKHEMDNLKKKYQNSGGANQADISKALLAAQSTGESIKKQAKKKADKLINAANATAAKLKEQNEAKRSEMQSQQKKMVEQTRKKEARLEEANDAKKADISKQQKRLIQQAKDKANRIGANFKKEAKQLNERNEKLAQKQVYLKDQLDTERDAFAKQKKAVRDHMRTYLHSVIQKIDEASQHDAKLDSMASGDEPKASAEAESRVSSSASSKFASGKLAKGHASSKAGHKAKSASKPKISIPDPGGKLK